jgi:hypothetical protein
LRQKVTKDVWRACKATIALSFLFPRMSALPLNLACAALVLLPESIAPVRSRGGDEAVELARFLRLAEVWFILMIGSALALAAALIQLALALQRIRATRTARPAHQRQRPGTGQDDERAVLAERIRRGAQAPHQLVGRSHNVHHRAAPRPAQPDVSRLERHSEPRGLALWIRRAVSLSAGASSSACRR